MELVQLIFLVIAALASLAGLVLVALQKLDIIHPVITQTSKGFNFVSGGTITLLGAFLGALILSSFSTPLMIVYLVVILAAYTLIQVIFHDR